VACALVVMGAGCQGYSTDTSAPVAVEIVTTRKPPFNLEEFDTMRVRVVLLDRAGDSIAASAIRLLSLNPDTLAIDSAIFGLVGVQPGNGRVIAFAGNLQSASLIIPVVRAPDSLVTTDSTTTDTVAAADTVSALLTAQLLDLRTDTTQKLGISWGDTIHFAITATYPPFAGPGPPTATLNNDSLSAAVVTSTVAPYGTAAVSVRRNGSPKPDSVVVQASARRANGSAVRGSPIQFVVHFQ
jgi:hypothetical protein